MNLHQDIVQMGQQAVAASRELAIMNSRKKNTILQAMADAIEQGAAAIRKANAMDLEEGRKA